MIELLITIVSSITTLGIVWIKTGNVAGKVNKRADLNKKEISNLMKTELKGVQSTLVKMETAVDELKSDTEFRNILKNSIRIEAARIVNLSFHLEQKFKDILMFWSVQIENLALKFYHSPYRNNPDEMNEYLTVDIVSRKSLVRNYTEQLNEDIRLYNNKETMYSDFLNESDAYRKLELLKSKLVENGLNKDEVTQVFVKFINQFFEHIIKATIIWKTLKKIN